MSKETCPDTGEKCVAPEVKNCLSCGHPEAVARLKLQDERCEACVFWAAPEHLPKRSQEWMHCDQSPVPICRRYPRHVQKPALGWCGEFQKKGDAI